MADRVDVVAIAEKYGLLPAQVQHRVSILTTALPTLTNSNFQILELGCGQGDCTVVLAHLVGPNGHIDAIDPAPLDYGAPETLGQAQARHKASHIGDRIQFHQADVTDFLAKEEVEVYDAAVLCHCLWYYGSEDIVRKTFAAVRRKAKTLCVAEWSLAAGQPEAYTHVLAVLTRATCEAHINDSQENIRSPLSPDQVKRLAAETGWKLKREGILTPHKDLEDAGWEVGMLLGSDGEGREFMTRAKERIEGRRVVELLEGMIEAVRASKAKTEAATGKMRCMDVWIGVFE